MSSQNVSKESLEKKLNTLRSQINQISDSLEEHDQKTLNNCEFIKAEIEIAAESLIEEIRNLKDALIVKLENNHQNYIAKFEDTEKKRINSYLSETRSKLDVIEKSLNESSTLSEASQQLNWEEKKARTELNAIESLVSKETRLNFISNNFESLNTDIIGKFDYVLQKSNKVLDFLIDIDRLESVLEPIAVNCNLDFDLNSVVENRTITYLPNDNLLITVSTINVSDVEDTPTQCKIVNEFGEIQFELFMEHEDVRLVQPVNEELVVIVTQLMSDFYISLYDLELTFQKNIQVDYSIQSIAVFEEQIYVLSEDEPVIFIYDKNLEFVSKIGHHMELNLEDSFLNAYSIYIQNNILFSETLTAQSEIRAIDLKTHRTLKNITLEKVNKHDGDVVKYVDALGRALTYNEANKVLRMFDTEGKQIISKNIESNGVFCLSRDGKIVFLNELCTLHIY